MGLNDTNFMKYMLWQGLGRNTSENSYIGQQIKSGNEKPRFVSMREIESTRKKRKTFNALYSWPITNVLEVLARNGKIDGIFLNGRQGWHFTDIKRDEIVTKHTIEWRPRYEEFEEFKEDMEMIRDYRVYHAQKVDITEENTKVLTEMCEDEWTMNSMDNYVTLKNLWHKYRSNIIKVKNLEFRLLDDNIASGNIEIPIIMDEDEVERLSTKYNATQLKIIENRWVRDEKETTIPSKKRKLSNPRKRKVQTEKIRIGSDEVLKELKEIKRLILSLKENEDKSPVDMCTLDKMDQIREVERSVYDEATKEMMIQIILSRQERTDLKYKILEEKLLSGRNYIIQMPRIETLRTNILGIIGEVDSVKTEEWEDVSLENRLQIITGNRIKTVFNHHIKNVIKTMIDFRKEIELANELKEMCEDKNGFDIVMFKDMLRSTIENSAYEDTKFEFLERWCVEIEENIEKGMKSTCEKSAKMSTPKCKEILPMKQIVQNRFTISSDDNSEENVPSTSGLSHLRRNQSKSEDTTKRKNAEAEAIVISSEEKSSEEEKSVIIQRENLQFVTYDSSDEENQNENVKKFITYSSSDSD